MSLARRKLAALGASFAIAFAGAGVAGCGDDDGEGPAEEAGQTIDEAGKEAGQAAEEGGKELDENLDVEVGDEAGKGE